MTQSADEKYNLNRIGKYGVLSELLKRNVNAHLPTGRYKNIVVQYADGSESQVVVKTSRTQRFVTNYNQSRYHNPDRVRPDYWIIVHVDSDNVSHFYIFTFDELGAVQTKSDGHPPEIPSRGCDCVTLPSIVDYENRWDIIVNHK